MGAEVILTGDLTIVGLNEDMGSLVTMTAAANSRHFKVNNAGHTLTLWHVKLTGGDPTNYGFPNNFGGAILIFQDGGELNLHSSIVSGNTAHNGGGIGVYAPNADENAIMNVYDSTCLLYTSPSPRD